jgi:hypothetical protein
MKTLEEALAAIADMEKKLEAESKRVKELAEEAATNKALKTGAFKERDELRTKVTELEGMLKDGGDIKTVHAETVKKLEAAEAKAKKFDATIQTMLDEALKGIPEADRDFLSDDMSLETKLVVAQKFATKFKTAADQKKTEDDQKKESIPDGKTPKDGKDNNLEGMSSIEKLKLANQQAATAQTKTTT